MAISTLFMRTGLALALSMMALGATAKPPPKPEFVRPEWLTRPTGEQVSAAPESQRQCHGDRIATAGSAVVKCDLAVSGRLMNCVVTRQEPEDCSYGALSLGATRWFQAKPRLPDGRKLTPGMKVRLSFRYAIPEG